MPLRRKSFTESVAVFAVTLPFVFIHAATAAEFMAGADISALAVLEDRGAVYRDATRPRDLVPMLAERGVNWFRLRLFVDPNGQGVVVNDLAYTLELARRVKDAGGKLLVDLHYSDTWADPGRQTKPAAWNGLSFPQLVQRVHDYTRDVMADFTAAGLAPEMVQIGNEVSNGLLWNDGYPWSGGGHNAGFDRLASLLTAGIAGAKAGAAPGEEPLVMLHHDKGADWSVASYYFDKLSDRQVDFDVIGYSYYPKWHYDPDSGEGSIAGLAHNLAATAGAFGKPVVVVETGFPSRGGQYEPDYEFPVSAAGQQQFLEAVIDAVRAVPEGLGWGAFWWYPEAVPVAGVNVWEGGRYGWFDASGNLLPTVSALEGLNRAPGDFDGDGAVDGVDLALWQEQYGASAAGSAADGDGDGNVDGADFLMWQRGAEAPAAGAARGVVAEPASGVQWMLAVGAFGALAVARCVTMLCERGKITCE